MPVATGGTTSIAGSAAGTNNVTVFDSSATGGGCKTFGVSNNATSTGKVWVLVTGLNTEAMPIAPGVSWPFRHEHITEVKIYGDGSNAATVDWGVLIR